MGLEGVPFSLACGFQAGQALVVTGPDRVASVAHLFQDPLVKSGEFGLLITGLSTLLDMGRERAEVWSRFSPVDL